MQVISVVGALAILLAYAANLLGWMNPSKLSYSVTNLIGSGILTVVAVIDQQLGFILLEGVGVQPTYVKNSATPDRARRISEDFRKVFLGELELP